MPFVGLMAGMLATVLFQSSSVTTSIIVGLVSAGSVSITGAIPMIMGANIGTSVTNTLVSLGYMNDTKSFKRAFAAATVHDFFNLISVTIFFHSSSHLDLFKKYLFGLPQWFMETMRE